MFDVRRLVVLREVVRCGSLSAAATAMAYTTSAVSQQITAFERDLGVTLLVRGHGGARPTPAGRRLLEHAEIILAAVEAAERDLIRRDHDPGTLRVASFSSAAAALLPGTLAAFRRTHPGVRVQLVPADPDEAIALLADGAVEAALITEVPGEASPYPEVHAAPVYDDEFFVVLPARHRLAGRAEVPLSALAGEEWVVSSATGTCPDTRVFHNACRRAGFTPSVTFHPDDYTTVQGLVAAGLGVSLVPALAAGHPRPGVAVRRVVGSRPVRRIAVATAAEPCRGGALAAFVGLLRGTGTQLANKPVYSFPATPFSVA